MRPVNCWIFLNFAEFSWIFLNFLEFSWISTKNAILWVSWCFIVLKSSFPQFMRNGLRRNGLRRNGLQRNRLRMDGPTDGRTDKASYRDAWTHLKTAENVNSVSYISSASKEREKHFLNFFFELKKITRFLCCFQFNSAVRSSTPNI